MNSTFRLCIMAFGILNIPILCRYYWHEAKELFPGALSCAIGALMNFLAVTLNGWQMPVSDAAYIEPGVIWKVANHPRVPWLIDRFQTSTSTYSAGDVLIYGGAILFGCGLLYRVGRRIYERI